MDEIGHSEWADSHQEPLYIPGDLTVGQVPISVERAETSQSREFAFLASGSRGRSFPFSGMKK
jgi:hypothetical protein